jgi:purine-binding chemotaxis protein CheW
MNAALDDVRIEVACFEVHGQLYGVDVQQIREIVRSQAVTPLPRAPGLVEGVMDLRGTIVPVVDLGRALGGSPCAGGPRARIAIVEVDGLVFGLRVDAAADVMAVAASDVDEPPTLVTQAGYEAVRAVVRQPGAPPTMVLSLEHLLECVYRRALESRPRDSEGQAPGALPEAEGEGAGVPGGAAERSQDG